MANYVSKDGLLYFWTLLKSKFVSVDVGVTHPKNTKVGSTTKGVYVDTDGSVKEMTYSLGQNVTSSSKLTDHITTATLSTATGKKEGNAVTNISADANGAITFEKSTTFLTSHQDISGKVNKTGDSMTGALSIQAPSSATGDNKDALRILPVYGDSGSADISDYNIGFGYIDSSKKWVNRSRIGYRTFSGENSSSETLTLSVDNNYLKIDNTRNDNGSNSRIYLSQSPASTSNNTDIATTKWVKDLGYLTAHPTITMGTNSTPAQVTLAHSGTFSAITGVTKDTNGHITAITTQEYKLPASGNTDTKVSTSNKADTKLFLIGATTQSTSGQAGYSNANCYVGTDNCLYSNGTKVITDISGKLDASQVRDDALNLPIGNQLTHSVVPNGYAVLTKLTEYVPTTTTINSKALSANITLTAGDVGAYSKTEIDSKLTSAMRYKGSKASVSALPTTGNVTGDMWNVTDTGANYVWDGSAWDETGMVIDLSAYAKTSDLVAVTNSEIDIIVGS